MKTTATDCLKRAENEIIGREYFGLYLAAIFGTLLENFPEECEISLDDYVGRAPQSPLSVSRLPDTAHGTSEWEETEKMELEGKAEEVQYEKKLRIARGTLLFALRNNLIYSPDSQLFIQYTSKYSLRDCTLTAKGYAALFRKPEEDVHALMRGIASGDGGKGSTAGDAPSLFVRIARILKDKTKEQVNEQVKDIIKERFTVPSGAALNTLLASLLASAGPAMTYVI